MIDRQDHFVVYQNRRCTKPVEHIEGTKWSPPTFLAVSVKRDQAKVLKKDVDVRAVGYRTRRGGIVYVLQSPFKSFRYFAFPKYFARLAIQSNYEKFVNLLLDRARFLLISELSTVMNQAELEIEDRIEKAVTKACGV